MHRHKFSFLRVIPFLVCFFLLACLSSLPHNVVPAGPDSEPQVFSITPHAGGVTFYVRTDGGSLEQCTGLEDAPYPGTGADQPCAWDHPFRALPPGGSPRMTGGDTLIIGPGSYMLGIGAPGTEACDADASYDCTMPPLPSGLDPTQPTRLLGAGWDSGCAAPPELWGTGRPWYLLSLEAASNAQVACLELTDHSSCIEDHLSAVGGSPYTCQRDAPPYGDWASAGLFARDSANVLLRDLNIHGLANTGLLAGRLTDWTLEDVRLVGNGGSGWDADLVGDGTGSENHGSLTLRRVSVEWNGCGETYPDEQHDGCWGQVAGGYGDGLGTGTTGGHWIIEDSLFSHNTSDGLDLFYARLPDAQVEIRRTIAEGNAGNQIKISGTASIQNALIVSSCAFFHNMPYWNNEDDCRANGDAVVFALNPGGQAALVNSTITGQGVCLAVAECALDQVCNGAEKVLLRNDIFLGKPVFSASGDVACFAWYDDESSNPLSNGTFAVDHSLFETVRFGNVDPCAAPSTNLCDLDPGLMDASLASFDARLQDGSPAIDAGTPDGAPSDDLLGNPRDLLPDLGAYEH
jgi:hypothetical protein